MNQDLEENRIRKLFRDLKGDDERLAPSFDSILRPAAIKAVSVRQNRRVLQIAIITAVFALIAGSVFAFFTASSPTVDYSPEKIITENVVEPVPPSAPEPETPKLATVGKSRRKRTRRKLPDRTLQAARLISEWRSPTGSLLDPSSKALFTTLPRTGESVVDLNWATTREKN